MAATNAQILKAIEALTAKVDEILVNLTKKHVDNPFPNPGPAPVPGPVKQKLKDFMTELWAMAKGEKRYLDSQDHYFEMSTVEGIPALRYYHPNIVGGFDEFGESAWFDTLANVHYPMLDDYMSAQFGPNWKVAEWPKAWGEDHPMIHGYYYPTGLPNSIDCDRKKPNGMKK